MEDCSTRRSLKNRCRLISPLRRPSGFVLSSWRGAGREDDVCCGSLTNVLVWLRSNRLMAEADPMVDAEPRAPKNDLEHDKGEFPAGTLLLVDRPLLGEQRLKLEASEKLVHHTPAFCLNLSDGPTMDWFPPNQVVHDSEIVLRSYVTLLGPNTQVDRIGSWACESRSWKRQHLASFQSVAFRHIFPGLGPKIASVNGGFELRLQPPGTDHIRYVEDAVFLATPLEPRNWARWIATTLPKIRHYRQHAPERKFFCFSGLGWQRDLLKRFGIGDRQLLDHDPGQAYHCRDIMTVDYSVADLKFSRQEREFYALIREESRFRVAGCALAHQRLFVSRIRSSGRHPNYRVLQNEESLAGMLEALGFITLCPETLSFDQQVVSYASAEIIVCLGGAALFNCVFCRPDTRVIDIESSVSFVTQHCGMLSSLDLTYGLIIGQQDQADVAPVHKRWSVDIEKVRKQVLAIM